jgi:hypothetical protein
MCRLAVDIFMMVNKKETNFYSVMIAKNILT